MPEELEAIRRAFDERSATYDESSMHRGLAAEVADGLTLEGVGVVLDVATGTGLVLRALAARATGIRLLGVDISPGMLGVARSALPSAEWIEADAVALPFASESVDLITCVTALHILPDVESAAAEWRRVLRPGGRLVTATFATAPQHRGDPHRSTPAASPYPRRHEPFASPEVLAATFGPLGFRLRSHHLWSDGTDDVLIAQLLPSLP